MKDVMQTVDSQGAGASANTRLPMDARTSSYQLQTRMWANAQRDGRPAKHRWRPLFDAAKFG